MAVASRTSRFSRGITAATTLAAMLSVAGAASAAGGPVHHEARAGLSDAQVVRVFAAVFEAMARDLLKPGHSNAALAARPVTLTAANGGEPLPLFEFAGAQVVTPLPVRLLDLPPPTS